MTDVRPYGTWPSPVTPASVARSGIEFWGITLSSGAAWWLERRPDEDGRGVVLRASADGEVREVTPRDVDVRTLVHEYGGGDFAVRDGTCWYVNHDDQRVYRLDPGDDPEPITPEPDVEKGLRYADFEHSPDGERIYCVRERHFEGEREPENALVSLPADGDGDPTVVTEGHDFYAGPRVSPDGSRLAWIAWDHPAMPFDETTLHVGDLTAGGRLENDRVVMGGGEDPESIVQPGWSPSGDLHAISDRTDWWNLFRVDVETGDQINLCPRDVEFGAPHWMLDFSTYAFLDDGRTAVLSTDRARRRLGYLEDGKLVAADRTDDVTEPRLATDGQDLLFVGGGPDTPDRLVRRGPGGEETVLRRSRESELDPSYVSKPAHVSFPTRDETFDANGFYYPPKNPDVTPPDDETPPVVVTVHGGPTGHSQPEYDPGVQFFTTRGIGVFAVNYRGSTGYGRAYRERLNGEWGVADVEDCVRAADYLVQTDRVDPDRLAIRGGSAGGYATLCALAFHDTFDAGISYYGVADPAALAEHTHKFESHYLDRLIGPYPEERELYRDRAPAHHAESIRVPVLLLQGENDPVVPPEQAQQMLAALRENGVPHAYLEFEGEEHGFRRAESVERARETELSFLGQVFDFDPDDDLEAVELSKE